MANDKLNKEKSLNIEFIFICILFSVVFFLVSINVYVSLGFKFGENLLALVIPGSYFIAAVILMIVGIFNIRMLQKNSDLNNISEINEVENND